MAGWKVEVCLNMFSNRRLALFQDCPDFILSDHCDLILDFTESFFWLYCD